ncbi:MAG: M23 family metallopeptidase [Oscillospiraceae bacterium]|nr:M23 family metallopeptidase [Oscillospiraceae bacterium]
MKNNRSKGFRSFVKEKGYYIVLLLCAVAVGVSGYFLITGDRETVPSESGTVSSGGPTEGTEPSVRDVVATEPSGGSTEATETAVILPPVAGESIHPFSVDALAYNETTRDWRTHEGVDLRAAAGESVTAVMDGTVHAIYEDASLGMTVVLRHAGNYTTHYSNLEENVPLSVGDRVKAGDVIGTVGQTALVETAAEPHLHFAVYLNNVPVDPMDFLGS